jgi:hypothetical protein
LFTLALGGLFRLSPYPTFLDPLISIPAYGADSAVQTPLLFPAPVINAPDKQHGAENYIAAIETVLSFSAKAFSHCVLLVGDNCAVNKRLARLMKVPLVGCASHRLNLAVKLMIAEFDSDLDMI